MVSLSLVGQAHSSAEAGPSRPNGLRVSGNQSHGRLSILVLMP